jgi:hypothetical protein
VKDWVQRYGVEEGLARSYFITYLPPTIGLYGFGKGLGKVVSSKFKFRLKFDNWLLYYSGLRSISGAYSWIRNLVLGELLSNMKNPLYYDLLDIPRTIPFIFLAVYPILYFYRNSQKIKTTAKNLKWNDISKIKKKIKKSNYSKKDRKIIENLLREEIELYVLT